MVEENVDYKVTSFQGNNPLGGRPTEEYYLTLETAKQIAMMTGTNNKANNKLKENSKLVRKYFILMEETLRNYEDWNTSRGLEKNGWNEMKKYVSEWCKRKGFDYTLNTFYIREANLLNQALLNHSASEINYILKNDDKITRDHLDVSINNALNELQQLNSNLLIADIDFDTRKDIIYKTCDTKYIGLKETFEKLVA
jgi:phage anti-repressor protein